jgi:DNA-directed RNA polymerase specialized sigma24 family protein
MSDDLFFHPELLAVIRGELRRAGCRPEWIEELVPQVIADVWKYLHDRGEKPDSLERLKAIARPIAYRRGIDNLRDKYGEKKAMEYAADEAAAKAAPDSSSVENQLEARRALENIQANQEGHDAAIIQGLTGGKSQKAVGEELKLSHDQARKAKGSMRERHARRLSQVGFVLAGVALLAGGFYFVVSSLIPGANNVGNGNPHANDTVEPPKPPLTPEQRKTIDELRTLAHAKALEKDWKACFEAYLAAERLDDQTPKAAKDEADMCKGELDKLEEKPR